MKATGHFYLPAAPEMVKFPVAIVRATSKQPNASWQTFSTRLAESGSSIGMDIILETTTSSEDSSWIL